MQDQRTKFLTRVLRAMYRAPSVLRTHFENVDHLLLQCKASKNIWGIIFATSWIPTSGSVLDYWMKWNEFRKNVTIGYSGLKLCRVVCSFEKNSITSTDWIPTSQRGEIGKFIADISYGLTRSASTDEETNWNNLFI